MGKKVYIEKETTIQVYDKCDILVVGGGAAGHSAAIAAARAGAKNIILMERYGYMGGNVTGGFVLMVPKLSWYEKSFVRGLQEEWFTRLENIPDAVLGPDLKKIGSNDPVLIQQWGSVHGTVSESDPKRIVRAVYYEPNQIKIEMDKMLLEHKDAIRVQYHSYGVAPIVEDGIIKGVLFESKEGRKAIFAKMVVDATGDLDITCKTGAPFVTVEDDCRCYCTALVWRIGGVDHDAYYEWKQAHPDVAKAFTQGISAILGDRSAPFIMTGNSIMWMNNWIAKKDCANIKDQTETEIKVRASIREILAYMKEGCPIAFRNAYLYDIAPQLGTRNSRRIVGDYVITAEDFTNRKQHDDVIAWHSTICMINDCAPVEIPYRALLPQKIENLICPGRHFSTDAEAIGYLYLIPQCVGTGQAAGVAAAVAVVDGTSAREVDIKKVQDILVKQDVPLPRRKDVDPSYMKCVEDHIDAYPGERGQV